MIAIDESWNGREVELTLGESVDLQLPENPTTGYRWHLRSPLEPVLQLQHDSFEGPGGTCGGGGVRHWCFHIAREGAVTLEMEYRRSWETRAIRTFTVTIHARPNPP
jgi:inhibitor of cysteine peptidase